MSRGATRLLSLVHTLCLLWLLSRQRFGKQDLAEDKRVLNSALWILGAMGVWRKEVIMDQHGGVLPWHLLKIY